MKAQRNWLKEQFANLMQPFLDMPIEKAVELYANNRKVGTRLSSTEHAFWFGCRTNHKNPYVSSSILDAAFQAGRKRKIEIESYFAQMTVEKLA